MRYFPLFILLAACTARTSAPPPGLRFDGAEGFAETARGALEVKGNPGEEIRLKNGDAEILIRSVAGAEPDSFDKAAALRVFELAQPFRGERSPYPGAVTDSVKCPDAFRPRQAKSENAGDKFWRAEVYASARKGPACNDLDFVSKGVELIAYCAAKKRLYTVHGYFPKDAKTPAWEKFLSAPSCPD